RQQAENLNQHYEREDIPSLIILKPNCEILTSETDEELISTNAIEKWTESKTVFWTPESRNSSGQVWLDIYCRTCYMKPLVGERYGCPNRECSYDLCAECYHKITKENEHNHELIHFLSPKNKYSIEQLLDYSDLISNQNERVTLKSYEGKYIGLYFSGLWCQTNENFASDLAQVYEKVIEINLPFDIIFISTDNSQNMFNKHCQQMPWKILPFDNYVTKLRLKTYFSVSILPAFIILKPTGELLTKSGQRDINIKKIEAIQTWCKDEKVEHSSDDFVWSSVTCDGCGMMPLIGKRFYCETCSNYDICTASKEKGHEHELILIAPLDEID
ncbi:unnamed protein product, partial [Rotaria sp. Silwood2]